ncbi:MAG: trypsin-like peptidase domain-containing protein [Myxococcales bacterium]|nr:trypsin-like peptidase domain-containing protein [Myxococcales bacterium]
MHELSEKLASAVESAGKSVVRVEGRRHRPASGVVFSPGAVVTAAHVLERAEDIAVSLGEKSVSARLAGQDPGVDLAVLKLDSELGSPAAFGEAANLKVGHLVLMLARPGMTVRATSGIVSALGERPWRAPSGAELARYLESDALHQPGYSGGPLVGLDGKALGINTSGLLRGVSLTVPSETVKRIADQLLAEGAVKKGFLGLSAQPLALPDSVRGQTGEEVGLLVLSVEPGGPAEKAGIHFGDTILRLGGDEVQSLADLQAFLRAGHLGETVPVKLYRSGQVVDLSITIGERS